MRPWEEFLQNQVEELGAEAIEKWAKTLKVVHFDAGNLYLEAQDAFQAHWFEEHLRPRVQKFLKNNNGRSIKVHLSFEPKGRKKRWKPALNLSSDPLVPECSFDTFFPSKKDEVHFSLLKNLIEAPACNPIYIAGSSGSGKTHLLMSCARFLSDRKKKCLYVKAGTLTQHIVAAIRSSSMPKLREFYRSVDVLILDDMDQLSGRSATQEEFFHTFNTLYTAGKQIILAGNRLPSRLEGIEPRLTSRFEWGIILSFHLLEKEERKEFLTQKRSLPEEIQEFLSSEILSMTDLIKAMRILKDKKDLTLKHVAGWIEPILIHQKHKMMTPEVIVKKTAEFFEITPQDILGRSQNQASSIPRQIAMFLCRKNLKLSFLKIADIFSRDHSTVMTSIRNVEKRIREQNNSMLSSLQEIELDLKF